MRTTAICMAVFLIIVCSTGLCDSDFYAYYTKVNSGQSWESYCRTGKHADIVVCVNEIGELIFSRASSYLPFWKTQKGTYYFDEIVARSGDGSENRPDRINRYSHVRIIENGADKITVHWRYFPDFNNVEWDGVVDEYFTITPDSEVSRRIRKGTEKISDWDDPENSTIQRLKLAADGIEQLDLKEVKLSGRAQESIEGSPVKDNPIGSPAAYWKFDKGLIPRNEAAFESISETECTIVGHKSYWKKGVSGTALGFDGYYSKVSLPLEKAPKISSAFTIEAWAALGAYPFDWAPVVHQSVLGKSGYYLGINEKGYPGFHISLDGKWCSVIHEERLDLFRWYNLAATFDKEAGSMNIYVDGELKESETVSGSCVTGAEADIAIGLNTEKMPPIEGRISRGKWPSLFGIDGLIDEVRIFSTALSERELLQSYQALKPSGALRDKPDMDRRNFPANPENKRADKFGAEYTKLPYYETWDNLWRVSEHSDIVVKFDQSPTRIVFWRGTSYGPALVTEKGKWVGDQSSENYKQIGEDDAEGCCEFMSDKQCRHSHVRIVENTDARVVIHWRYGMVDSRYIFSDVDEQTGWGDWADEYWTIYPDAVAIRYLERGWIWPDSWVETLFYSEPGTMPEDNVELKAYTLVNMEGEAETYSWEKGSPECDLEEPVISMVNTKSKYRPFNIYPTGSSVETFSGRTRPSRFHWWNHFPVSQITSDGRGARASDRAAHSSLVWGSPSTNYLLYGLTNEPAAELIGLAKSWNTPPAIIDATGCSNKGYKPQQRAYELTAYTNTISFRVLALESVPVVNPCFVIKNWCCDDKVSLKMDGKIRKAPDFRQGIVRDTDGRQSLVIWIKTESTEPLRIEITPTTD